MEIEIKIRLESRKDYDAVINEVFLPQKPLAVHHQRNIFFDRIDNSLSNTKSVMRLRVINGDSFILTLKRRAVLEKGISRVEETEEELDHTVAEKILADPSEIQRMAAKSKLISHILAAFPGNDHWKTLGQFENKRTKFEWKSVVVEVDETKYPFGYGYEIEVETEQPERVKGDLENCLRLHGIRFKDSTRNKFVNMLRGSIE